ncbi:MAG: hypothetical protein IKH52_03515 [Bacteroidaceae bacterium]|nr:hypothetical protein [Bacteroidaceae bacterium]
MKQYKKPAIVHAELKLSQSILTASPNKGYNEEGSGQQLTRGQLWLEEEEN